MPSLVLHIPHSAAVTPAEARTALALDDEQLALELLCITDWFKDELFELPSEIATSVRFPISRMVVDPERLLDDTLEPMAAHGMGVIYTRTTDGDVLREPPSAAERESLLDRVYRPHHERLSRAVEAALEEHDRCLLIDAHSFPDRPLPCHVGLYGEAASPDICIGADGFHTPPGLADELAAAMREQGWTVPIDRPFAGSLVPMKHFGKGERVTSVMVEVNRRLYMDESTAASPDSLDEVRDRIACVLRAIASRG